MKFFYSLLIIAMLSTLSLAKGITERTYNYIFNLKGYEPLEAQMGQKGDEVDALFDKAGLSSADSRKAKIKAGMFFMNNKAQSFVLKEEDDGTFVITSKLTNNAVTVENNSKDDGAAIVHTPYTGADNQRFYIKRDTSNFRYAAFIIAKHSGMAIAIDDKGNIIQQKLDPNNKGQIWAFSYRQQFKNVAAQKYLGLEGMGFGPANAVLVNPNSTTSAWCYIAHPSSPNIYYVMNALTKQFLMSREDYNKDALLDKYSLYQSSYKKGRLNSMLFFMVYSDDTKESLYVKDYFTKYCIDIEPNTTNLVLVPVAAPKKDSQCWGIYEAKGGL